MAGIKALRKIQLGREVTAGTAVAATALWRGQGAIEDQRKVNFVEEDIGIIGGADRSNTSQLLAALAMASVEATFEQLPHIFEAGIKVVGTGVADGVGTGKIYAYPFPTTAKNTIKTYTLEMGDDQAVEEMEYGFVEAFKIEGKAGEALMVSADWKGRQVSVSSFTGAIAVPTVEDILTSKGKVYIDEPGGTIGTTQVSQTVLELSLDVQTGWVPVFTMDGNLYFAFAKITRPEITLEMTFEHDGTATAEKAKWRSDTARLLRLQFEGANLGTGGTLFQKKTFRIDLAGKWEKFGSLEDTDGNDTVKGTFRARYNATAAKFAELTVVNELATVP